MATPEGLRWSDDKVHQAYILDLLGRVDLDSFLRYNPNEKGDCKYLPDALTWNRFYKNRVNAEFGRGNLPNVLALLEHHRRQYGDDTPRFGGLHGEETQGPRDALAGLVRTIELTEDPSLEPIRKIFEAKLVQAEEEYRLSIMTRAERMKEEYNRQLRVFMQKHAETGY